MAKGKTKPDGKITQLALFPEEQPADHGEVEEQPAISHTEEPVEAVLPKKRARNKKAKDQEPRSAMPAPDHTGEPVAVNASASVEEEPIIPTPAEAGQTDEKENRQKEKYKKIQEERLAALRKARGIK